MRPTVRTIRALGWMALVLLQACSSNDPAPGAKVPRALVTAGDGIVHIGRRVARARPGEVLSYGNLSLPDGIEAAWVEIDSEGMAASFEFRYEPEKTFADVVQFYTADLGPPSMSFARLVGDCVVWQEIDVRFEVCRSRDENDHGLVIAHAWPVLPIEV